MEPIRRRSAGVAALTAALVMATWPMAQRVHRAGVAVAAPGGEGRVVRVRYSRDPRTLEPGLFLELITGWISKDLHAGLLRFDEKMQPAPFIARSWRVSADGLIYTFSLRDDVRFHNGRRVVASDFVYTFTRMLTPRIRAAAGPQALSRVKGAREYMEGRAASVEGLQAPNDTTFRMVLAQPDPALPLRLATVFLSVIPREAVVDGEPRWRDKPVGAGAFRFVEWQPQVRIVLEANPDYFLGRPKIDRIESYTVPDVATALAQYQRGELDIIDVRGAQLAQVNSDPALKRELKEFPRAQLLWFGLNQRRVPAFRDKRVRQAFVYALHRQALIEKVMLNDRYLATGFVPRGIPDADPTEQAYPHDPAKARQLLAEAGFPGGRGFPRIEVVSTADETTLVEAIVAQLKTKLGIDAVVRIGESGDVLTGMWAKDKWDMWSWGWSADRPSAEVWLYELMYGGLESNFVSYNNPEYNRMVDRARSETDPNKRIAAWREVARMAHEEVPYVPFGFAKFLYLVKPHVRGFSADLLGPKRLETVEVVR
ncbi:MAG: ABC transporter substrate-binding protein [Armatimonadota bacterium]|nr:ABC transporter substrate-binding protein [Armatimonadota bacterium]